MLYEVKETDMVQEIKEATTKDLLKQVGLKNWTLEDLNEATAEELAEVSIKEKQTCLMFLELGKRIERMSSETREQIMGSRQLGARMAKKMKDYKQEHLVAILLNTQNEIIKEITVFKGTINKSIAEPREILHHALKHLATSIILVHNHPSGSTHPSLNDDETTERVRDACDLVGITLLDHLIVGGGSNYYSYREETSLLV